MNIWKIIKNEGYNNAFLIDSAGKQRFDKDSDYMDIVDSPPLRTLKTKTFIERYYGNLSIQFFPCYCSQYPKLNLWIWNACEYHDVLDVDNSVCDKIHNLQGKEVIKSVDKYVFKKEAFDLDFFKIYLGERKYTTYLFVSDRFKETMEENNVTGLALEKVYSI